MNHLEKAKKFARSADGVDIAVEWAQVYAMLASAHAQIAMIEQKNKAIDDAEIAAERAELMQKKWSTDRAPYGG